MLHALLRFCLQIILGLCKNYISCVLLFFTFGVFGQGYNQLLFERIDPLLGLTNQNITSINQCDSGYLWVATENGLFKYGGNQFEPFHSRASAEKQLANDVCHTITKYKNNLLLGLRQHFAVVNPSLGVINNNIVQFNGMLNDQFPEFFGLKQFNDSAIFVFGPPGLFIFYPHTKQLKKWKLPCHKIEQDAWVVDVVKIGNFLAISTWWNGVWLFNLNTKQFVNYLSKPLVKNAEPILGRMQVENDSMLWIGTWNQGLIVLNVNSGQATGLGFQYPNSGFSFFGGGPVLFQGDSIWICSRDEGLFLLDKKNNRITNYKNEENNQYSIPYNYVNCIFKDNNNIIWIGTQRGLAKINLKNQFAKSISLKTYYKTDSIAVNEVLQAAIVANNTYLLGNYQGLYGFHNGKYFRLEEQLEPRPSVFPSKLERFNNQYFLGFWGGFYTFQVDLLPDSLKLVDVKKILIPNCQSLVNGLWNLEHNNYLISTKNNGVFLYNLLNNELKPLNESLNDSLKAYPITANFYNNKTKKLFLGTRTGNYFIYSLLQNKITHHNNSNWPGVQLAYPVITGIVSLNDSLLYLATDYGGLYKCVNGVFFKEPNLSVSSSRIKRMIAGPNKSLLLLTDNGIDFFDINTNQKRNFGLANGITTPHYLYALNNYNNHLFTSETYKFYDIDLNSFANEIVEEPFLINNISIDGVNLNFTGQKLILLPSQTAISISFEKLSLGTAKPNYRYRIKGEEAWQNLGTNNRLFLTGLQNGDLVVELQATDSRGNWYSKIIAVPILKKPYFFQTIWFYAIIALLAIVFVIAWYRIKLSKLRALHAVRNQIAADLHDEIGSTLSSINLYSKIILDNHHNNINIEMLQTISSRAEDVLGAVQDIVWTVNPHNDSLEILINRIRFYAIESLEKLGVIIQFNQNCDFNNVKVKLIAKRNLILFFKEVINNISKHSHAKHVVISIEIKQKQLLFSIIDDGVGYNTQIKDKGNGLLNMQRRAKEMNAQLAMASYPGAGTKIVLLLPIT